MRTCRVCNSPLFSEPLLHLPQMPAQAQNLPSKADLPNDCGVDLDVWQCSSCGLVQLNRDPVPYYRDVIRSAGFSQEMAAFRRLQFAQFLKKYSLLGKKVVEIGCGEGEYARL